MTRTEWIVHPNRSEIGSDEPGQNGHFRSVSRPRTPVHPNRAWPESSCRAGCLASLTLTAP